MLYWFITSWGTNCLCTSCALLLFFRRFNFPSNRLPHRGRSSLLQAHIPSPHSLTQALSLAPHTHQSGTPDEIMDLFQYLVKLPFVSQCCINMNYGGRLWDWKWCPETAFFQIKQFFLDVFEKPFPCTLMKLSGRYWQYNADDPTPQ